MLSTFLCIAVACWCWFGNGPYFLRWPAVLMVVVLTSGHPLAAMLGPEMEQLAAPLLTLLFMIFGLSIILRGIFGRSWGRDPYRSSYNGRYGRGVRHDRW